MKRIPVKYHVLFWLGLIIMGVITLSPYYLNLFKATMHRVVFIPVWLIATYTNLYLLLPRLFDKGKKILYGITLTAFILVLTYFQRIVCIQYIYPKYFWLRAPNEDELNPFWLEPFIQFAGFIALPVILSIGIRQAWKWYNESYKAKQVIAEQQEAELSYLKAQVNPHFLFNTLNSLYGLSLESSKKVPEMILKLSDLLSYSLYESKVQSVSIEKEMDLIDKFIALEKARFEERMEVVIDIGKDVNQTLELAPLLMLPLVENAIKHGLGPSDTPVLILIHLEQKGQMFNFNIENPLIKLKANDNETVGGMGLKNLKRRLQLHYPDRHFLEINETKNKFIVKLQIQIDE